MLPIDRLRRRRCRGRKWRAAEAVRPAFGEPERPAVGRNGDAVRIIQVPQQAPRAVERRRRTRPAGRVVLLHEIANPILARVPAAAVGHEDAAVGCGGNAGEAVQRLVFDLIEPGLPAAGGRPRRGRGRRRRPAGGHRDEGQDRPPRRRTRRRPSAPRSRHRPAAAPACPRRHRSRRRRLRRHRRRPEAASPIGLSASSRSFGRRAAVHRRNCMLIPVGKQDLLEITQEIGEEAHDLCPVPSLVAPIGLIAGPGRVHAGRA